MVALDKDAFYLDLGQKVRAVREERKLTQEALASLLGITRTSVTNIEKGRQKMLSVSPYLLMPSMQYSSSLEDALKEQLNQKELNWVQEAMNEIQRD